MYYSNVVIYKSSRFVFAYNQYMNKNLISIFSLDSLIMELYNDFLKAEANDKIEKE